jgi:anti-sigma regulatory factor (Ser/Thr protein kinase)
VDLTSTESIMLTVPATSAAVRIARAGAAGLATRAGFTYHEVEHLQLAVGEAAGLLAPDPQGDGTLALCFEVEPDGLRIDLHLIDAGSATAEPLASAVPGIAAAVLDAAVDRWHVGDRGRRIILEKRVSDTEDDDD